MNDELKAAEERFRSLQYCRVTTGNGVGNPASWPIEQLYWGDSVMLARAYLADLAAREAEERERALPIDEAWLRPLCRSVSVQEAFWFIDEDVFLVRWACGFNLKMNDRTIADHATRGDLLDLLAGLKIPTKGGAE